jgi:hypothetical protein
MIFVYKRIDNNQQIMIDSEDSMIYISNTLKQLAVFILSLSLLSLAFKEWFVITTFLANRTAIAKQYCVNRNNPKSCCEGSCYLSSSLQDMNDEENPAVLQDSEEIAQYLLPERADNIPVSISIHRMDHFTYLNWLDRIFAKKWLDPPQQIVIS